MDQAMALAVQRWWLRYRAPVPHVSLFTRRQIQHCINMVSTGQSSTRVIRGLV